MELPPQSEIPMKLKVGLETNEWTSDVDAELPISSSDLPGFKQWINFNGFNYLDHPGIDLSAYINQQDELVIGLPAGTPIRAASDGKIAQISNSRSPYHGYINILHGDQFDNVMSGYHHIVPNPDLQDGQEVKKGDIIGFLYQDPKPSPEGERLVHLHLALCNGWGLGDQKRTANPENIFPDIAKLRAEPFLSLEPQIVSPNDPSIVIQPSRIIRRENLKIDEGQHRRVNNIR